MASHISDEFRDQWGGVVLPPDKHKRQSNMEILHRHQGHALRAAPTGAIAHKRHTQSARNETQKGGFVHGLLNDSRALQSTPSAIAHQAIVERRAFPSRKPNEI